MLLSTRKFLLLAPLLAHHCLLATALQLFGFGNLESQSGDKCSPYQSVIEQGTLGSEIFLIMTGPNANKVYWTEAVFAKTWRALDGKVSALIDNMGTPGGVAWDRQNGRLYIASLGDEKIASFRIRVEVNQHRRKTLKVDGDSTLILENVKASWLSCDTEGNLYFTDEADNTVNKLERKVLSKIEKMEVKPSELKKQTALQAAAAQAQPKPEANLGGFQVATPPPIPPPVILQLAHGDPWVRKPSGIAANTDAVYWGNGANMTSGGLMGTDTHVSKSYKVLAHPGNIFGVEITANSIFYSYNDTIVKVPMSNDLDQNVKGVATTVLSELQQPRGLAYDQEGTVFVALNGGNSVVAIPSGVQGPTNAEYIVAADGVFDIAIVSCKDEGLNIGWAPRHEKSVLESFEDLTTSELGSLMAGED